MTIRNFWRFSSALLTIFFLLILAASEAQSQAWTISITAESLTLSESTTVEFGVDENATDGNDPDLDVTTELPPSPFDLLYLNIAFVGPDMLVFSKDIRPAGPWNCLVKTNDKFTLSWQTSEGAIPDNVLLLLNIGDGSELIDMKMVSSRENIPAGTYTMTITAHAQQEVNIPDANFEAAIREALNKPDGPLTDTDLATLTLLNADERNISDLTGLEYCTSLTKLDLARNQITDLGALQNLTSLTELTLSGNQISDVSPLQNVTSLTKLFLDGNQISDLQPLVDNSMLDTGDHVNVKGNPLSSNSLNTCIPTLQARGVTVEFDPIVSSITVSPDPIDFGNVIAGESATVTVSIGNDGDAELNVTDITALASVPACGLIDVTISDSVFTIAPNDTHDIILTLTASSAGEISGTLTITSNEPNSPKLITISAFVLVPTSVTILSPTADTEYPVGADIEVVAEVKDQLEQTMAGVEVTFSGNVSPTSATTDDNGQAKTQLTVAEGDNTVTVTVTDPPDITGTVNVIGVLVPASVTILSPTADTEYPVGADIEVVAEVKDQLEQTMAGVEVTFSGNVSPTFATTDANGQAKTQLTVAEGDNTVTVIVTDSPDIIGTVTVIGVLVPTSVTILSPTADTEYSVGTVIEVVAEVKDQLVQMTGIEVTFSGNVSSTSATTDANGQAETTLTIAEGQNTITVTVTEYPNVTDTVTVTGVTPTPQNDPPEIIKIGGKDVPGTFDAVVGEQLVLDVEATDLDGDIVSYEVFPKPTGASINETTGVFTWAPTSDQVGTYTIEFMVIDSMDEYDSANVTITVQRPPSLDTEAEITSVTITGSPAKLGGIITVTLVGETNGTATFSIAGVTNATDVAMTEYPSGNYVGSYTAKMGDDVMNATVTVTLTDAMGNIGTDATKKVTIDTVTVDTVAEITSVTVTGSPAKAGSIINVILVGEPNGTATFSIDGVTNATNVAMTEYPSGNYVGSYTARIGDDVENATITVTLMDAMGNINTNATQKVTIDTIAKITSVAVTGSPAKSGSIINVILVGEPNGTVAFSIDGVTNATNVAMTGGTFGNYVGGYTARMGDDVEDATVTVTLTDAMGNEGKYATQKVTIDTIPPTIASATFGRGEVKAGETVVLTVITEPGAIVTADISALDITQMWPVTLVESTGLPGAFTVSVTANAEPGDKIVTITAEDIAGNATIPPKEVTIELIPSFIEFDLTLNPGFNLISIPLADATVEETIEPISMVKNLADALGKDAWSLIVSLDAETGTFRSYTPTTPDDAKSNVEIMGDTGLIVIMRQTKTLKLRGNSWQPGDIALNQGLNLVGIPLKDESLVKMSDLAERINGNVNLIVSLNPDKGVFQSFIPGSTPDDALSNITIDGGVGLILVMGSEGKFSVTGEPWSNKNRRTSPIASPRKRLFYVFSRVLTCEKTSHLMLDQTISPILELDGTVAVNGLFVTVRNLSSDAVMTDKTGLTAGDGRFSITFVDFVTNQSAKVGDVLEVSFKDPNGKLGVDSIRYVVTENDIQLGRISLDNLVAYTIPTYTELLQNWPNPFNPETWIPFKLKEESDVAITIYDINGRIVRTLELGHIPAGLYKTKSKAAYWDGANDVGEHVASGVYFYRIQAGNFSASRKMAILK